MNDQLKSGTVKWYNATKGYGFIQPDDGTADVFVHVSAIESAGFGKLNEGQRVNYSLQDRGGKVSAINLSAA
jgi:CspA family cold shock protein